MSERNAKVRKRLAAGKLRLRIRDLRNLGPRMEQMLEKVGIRDVAGLRERGALEAYLALRRAGVTRSLNALWALAGALEPWPEGRDWRDVAKSESRLALLLQVEGRERTREAVLAAAGQSAGRRARTAKTPSGARQAGQDGEGGVFAGEAWAPGLPFDEAPKRKNRR